MRIFDIIGFCWRNLTRRKMRTALTAFGVVIGVCAILVMISIGIGLSQFYDEMLASWGDLTVINIYNWGGGGMAVTIGGGSTSSSSGGLVLDDEVVAKIQALPGVDIATPFYQPNDANFQFKSSNGRYQAWGSIYGVYPEALEKLGYKLKEGTYLHDGDKEYSVVAGEQFAYRFRDVKRERNNMRDPYPDQFGNIPDPFVNLMKDKMILFGQNQRFDNEGKPQGKDLEVRPNFIGILEKNDQNWEATNSVFMDINELKGLVQKYNKMNGQKTKKINYEDVRVKCVDVESVASVQDAIKEMGFECYSMNDSREMMQEQAMMIQMVLGGLAAISLFVAAIGIANTMVMSIYERTREIGVMKVIGAELRDIRVLFLMEAGMIGFIGGVVGVVLSYLASYALNTFAGGLFADGMMGGGGTSAISVIPPWLVLFALVFSIFIGVLFGFLPANRAVKISALEAIKHD
ncbi:MAG: ABC transporter permease [Angelakisella sp.]|nr:ABC transporter permease [Angelakisella sp.]